MDGSCGGGGSRPSSRVGQFICKSQIEIEIEAKTTEVLLYSHKIMTLAAISVPTNETDGFFWQLAVCQQRKRQR